MFIFIEVEATVNCRRVDTIANVVWLYYTPNNLKRAEDVLDVFVLRTREPTGIVMRGRLT